MAESYEVESVVRGYHIYKEIWSAAVGTTLPCQQESFNPYDSYAVAIIKDDLVVGHMLRNISVTCSAFLRRGDAITCTVTGARQYSNDLPQGGLKVPCRLKFSACSKEISKIVKLLPLAPLNTGGTMTIVANTKSSTPSKPGPVSSSVATDPLSVKCDVEENYCDLTMEAPPIIDAGQATVPQQMRFGLSYTRLHSVFLTRRHFATTWNLTIAT